MLYLTGLILFYLCKRITQTICIIFNNTLQLVTNGVTFVTDNRIIIHEKSF